MPNKTAVKEWLVKAYHDLSSAQVLYDANHYTDTLFAAKRRSESSFLRSSAARLFYG